MKTILFLVTRTDDSEHWDYDEYRGFVVRAMGAEHALEMVREQIGKPPHGQWEAEPLKANGVPGIVLSDFHAG